MKENTFDIVKINGELKGKTAKEILLWATGQFGQRSMGFASSLGAEDQVITDILRQEFLEVGIFTIDTGRLPQESHDLMQATMEKYGFHYEVLCPHAAALAALVAEHGPNLFYKSEELRRACCQVRKVAVLKRKLVTLKAWICGLRRSQGVTRGGVEVVEWDEANGLVKINPLATWSEEKVWDYIRTNHVPYNALHDKGFPSIGCAPCTRAVALGEDLRAGRWWWESAEHKECGLHRQPKSV